MRTTTSAIRVACAQTDPVLGDIAASTAASVDAIRTAADAGADVVVLPECASSGWAFADEAEARPAAQGLDGETIRAWHAEARERDLWVCGGFAELGDDGRIYNSSALVSPDGVESVYRKVHLWNTEHDAFTPGDRGFPVVETPFGRVGMLICYDAWIPESFRSLGLQGADLVLAPSDWVPNPRQPEHLPPSAHIVTMAGAQANQCYVASASRVGTERGTTFIGASIIVDPFGWPLTRPGTDGVDLIWADIDPLGTRESRLADPFNRPLGDRRADAYATGMEDARR
ncbi:nitrilase-related carbon-nitrogen hydrolase [Agrococcus carbonis]|uniref:Predicted amidohydrolase n=1 Tax=Agrococcus carbonis TaxID=684552 RepID=A0A1H1NJJ8_9MICO|nr:nitrilase-related carbon-nitrogen hydrolase [Agrococcus carbonis]SDR99010.1 Predicted amidohydrolase [Agrococcus carbonis]